MVVRSSNCYSTVCTYAVEDRRRNYANNIYYSAILKDAPILVCDEATSALDGATERQIIDTLRSISHDRTTIVIAHRLSTVQHADLIIVLNEGKVAEVGSPKELLRKKDSLYSVMWQKQQQQDREALCYHGGGRY